MALLPNAGSKLLNRLDFFRRQIVFAGDRKSEHFTRPLKPKKK